MSGWAAAATAATNIFGGWMQNRSNAKEAKKNRAFQERMSSTAHVREAADLEKAGLNRILSLKQSGASTPGGAQAKHENILKDVVSSAQQSKRMGQELKNLEATEKGINAQTSNTNMQTIVNMKKGKMMGLGSEVGQDASDLYRAGKSIITNEIIPFVKGVPDAAQNAANKFINSNKDMWKKSIKWNKDNTPFNYDNRTKNPKSKHRYRKPKRNK